MNKSRKVLAEINPKSNEHSNGTVNSKSHLKNLIQIVIASADDITVEQYLEQQFQQIIIVSLLSCFHYSSF